MHAKSYLEELQFIIRAVPSWSGRAKLLASTTAFHLNNARRRKGTGRDGFDLTVMIGDGPRTLHLRQKRGDLFILYEVLAREAYAIPASVLDPEKVRVILDCGANIGITALYLASRYPNARIICIEPDPDNFEVLKHNIAGNARIESLWAAVVAKSGPVNLSRDRPAYGNKVVDAAAAGATVQVPGLTIADICLQHGLVQIDLLKVDIEGAEHAVFADASFLTMVGFVAIELHPPYGLEAFREAIEPYGFSARPPGQLFCRHAHVAFRR